MDESKLLTKEELLNVSAGDWLDCDVLHESLKKHGYKAEYKNVYSDSAFFLAVFKIDGEEIGAVEGSDAGHMVRKFELPEKK